MRRRTALTTIGTVGTVLLAGCSSIGGTDTTTTEPEESPEETTTEESTTTTSTAVSDVELSFQMKSGMVKIAHNGGPYVTDEATRKLLVTVDGERADVWQSTGMETRATFIVADEDASVSSTGSTSETTTSTTETTGEATTSTTTEVEETKTALRYPFSVGNQVFVDAPPSATVEVVWHGEDGETETLGTHTVPESTTASTNTTES